MMELGGGKCEGTVMHYTPCSDLFCCLQQQTTNPPNNQPENLAEHGPQPMASIAVACIFNSGGIGIELGSRVDHCCCCCCLLLILVLFLSFVFAIIGSVDNPHTLSIIVMKAPVIGLLSFGCFCQPQRWHHEFPLIFQLRSLVATCCCWLFGILLWLLWLLF